MDLPRFPAKIAGDFCLGVKPVDAYRMYIRRTRDVIDETTS